MNINITDLIERSVNILKSKYKLPEQGFLTGSSLSNTIFGILTNTPINFSDIDVFIISAETEESRKTASQFKLVSDNNITKPVSSEYPMTLVGDRSILIKSSEEDGIVNVIRCVTDKDISPKFVEGFDLNCVKVAYCLETGESYWSKDFEQFLTDKKIRITYLGSPQQASIRYLKKCSDLNLPVDKEELDMVYIFMLNSQEYLTKSFGSKMYEKYKKHTNILNKYFIVEETSREGKPFYSFILNNYPPIDYDKKCKPRGFMFNHRCFPTFYRNILGNEYLEMLYKKLNVFIDQDINYIDTNDALPYQVDMISCLIDNTTICYNLAGLKLSEQISLIDKLFEQFYDDQLIAYSILYKIKFNRSDYTESDLLALSYTTIRTRQTSYVIDNYNLFKKRVNGNKK